MILNHLRRWSLLATLLLGISGCSVMFESEPQAPETGRSEGRILIVVSLSRFSHPSDHAKAAATVQQMVTDFRSLHPNARISYRLLRAGEIDDLGMAQARSGLGPDLILMSAANLGRLRRLGVIQEAPSLTPEQLHNFSPASLAAVRDHQQLLALPAYENLMLMCYDRSVVPAAPQNLDDLVSLASQGQQIGLHNNLSVLHWVTSALGLDFSHRPRRPSPATALLNWSRWLTWAQVSPNVTMTSFSDLIYTGLQDGRYDLISCPAFWLPSLRHSLGNRLGIAPLPSGPAGPGRPITDLIVWAFGRNSSLQQRTLAMDFALFTTNAEQQRRVILRHQSLMPVNPEVRLPLKSYPDLRTLNQVSRDSELVGLPREEALQAINPTITHLLDRVMAGELPAAREAPRLLNLLDPPDRSQP